DADRGLIFVKGSVPGSKNAWLLVRDAVKLPLPEGAPFPGAILEKKTSAPEREEAPAGMVEAAAEHEVTPEVSPEQQENLLQEQQAGAAATAPRAPRKPTAAKATRLRPMNRRRADP